MTTHALAQRLVVCPGWRWCRGMVVIREAEDAAEVAASRAEDGWPPSDLGIRWSEVLEQDGLPDGWVAFPDLTDPGTLGHVLALVREAWMDPGAYADRWPVTPGDASVWYWVVYANNVPVSLEAATEAEALVVALEAAGDVGEADDKGTDDTQPREKVAAS